MIRIIALLTLFIATAIALACGGGATPNANSNTSAAKEVKLDNANLPPGISAAPVATNVGAPGIPVVIANMPKGATPTPGIPSAEEMKKGPKKGTTPTPGIPSPEELRRQMSGETSPNIPPPNSASDAPMMRQGPPMMKKNANKVPTKP
ncbi:MAG TPA: hypothetical protein PKA82_07430 [Pyrinomonadaceae bacterium]|nr:hypothetical protein [Pyrinomonadaceae bacterium]